MNDEFGWSCPQCENDNISSKLEVDMDMVYCDDCKATVKITLSICVDRVEIVERGTNHDEEEE
jgi:hypothetical protein